VFRDNFNFKPMEKKTTEKNPNPNQLASQKSHAGRVFSPSLDHSTSATNVSSLQARQNRKGNPFPACWSNTWTLRLRNDDNMMEECGV